MSIFAFYFFMEFRILFCISRSKRQQFVHVLKYSIRVGTRIYILRQDHDAICFFQFRILDSFHLFNIYWNVIQ